MLRQTVQGTRWYQHVARTNWSIGTLPRLRAFSVQIPRCTQYGGPNDKVNFYEQTTRHSKDIRKVDPEADDKAERKDAEDELAKLDKELDVLKEGPFGPNSPFMKSMPEKDRLIALEALRKHEEKEGKDEPTQGLEKVFDGELDDVIREEFEDLARDQEDPHLARKEAEESLVPAVRSPYEVVLPESSAHSYVDRFNNSLRLFVGDSSDDMLSQEIWRWYRRCKYSCPAFLESMPEEAVTLVWNSQVAASMSKTTKATHLQALVDDATALGRTVATPHMLSYMDALMNSGETNRALGHWEAHKNDLPQVKEDLDAYWKFGVHLFAAADDPRRAQIIAQAFFVNDRTHEPRILIPIITAWGRQPGKKAEISTWKLYLQLKTHLGREMTMEDYDTISIGLLKAGRLDTALAIFKDMMVTDRDPATDSTALYKGALGLAGNLQASSINEQDVNQVSLSVLTFLPRRFENRFFYASWLKKLIGMGEADSAALVIELMFERGVRPDARHLNGLIAAWIREGSPSAKEKAERLGWAMIQQRIDTVWARTSQSSPRQVQGTQGTDNPRIPKWMQRQVPSATIETFSVMLLQYTRRSDEDMIKYLIKCLSDAQIQPNAFIMNHLLYAELRKHNLGGVWEKYTTMAASVAPDLETFVCLWDSGKVQYDMGRSTISATFPSARKVHSEMMGWYNHLSPRAKSTPKEEFSKDLYDQIIRCFCISKDIPGTIVAMYSLALEFGIFPDDVTARMIVLQVARFAGVPTNTPSRRLRRLKSTPKAKENIAHVNRLLEILSSRKAATLEMQGLALDSLDPHEKQQYQLEVLAMLLRVVMSRMVADPSRMEDDIAAVATEMGVSGVYLGSPLGEEESSL